MSSDESTVGVLLMQLRNAEILEKRALDYKSKQTGPLEKGSISAHYFLQADQTRGEASDERSKAYKVNGYEYLSLLCEKETGTRIDSKFLNSLIATYCLENDATKKSILEMPAAKFVLCLKDDFVKSNVGEPKSQNEVKIQSALNTQVFKRNEAHFKALVELVKNGKITPFVGAGASISAGCKSWGDYLKDTALEVGYTLEIIQPYLDNYEYEELLDLIISKSDGERAFEFYFEDDFSHVNAISSYVSHFPDIFPACVITTNFDRVLEDCYRKHGTSFFDHDKALDDPAPFLSALNSGKHHLLKLHGNLTSKKHRVFTKSEYINAYASEAAPEIINNSAPIPEFLNHLYPQSSLLFVGCSLSVDRTVSCFEQIAKTNKFFSALHYAIIEKPGEETEFKDLAERLNRCNIKPIWYETKQFPKVNEIIELIKILVSDKKGWKVDTQSNYSVDPEPSYTPTKMQKTTLTGQESNILIQCVQSGADKVIDCSSNSDLHSWSVGAQYLKVKRQNLIESSLNRLSETGFLNECFSNNCKVYYQLTEQAYDYVDTLSQNKVNNGFSKDDILVLIQESSCSDWETVHKGHLEKTNYTKDISLQLRFEMSSLDEDLQQQDFKEPWANRFPDPNATGYFYDLYYGQTLIERFILVGVDGERALLPLPIGHTKNVKSIYYKVAQIHDQLGTLDEYMQRVKFVIEGNSNPPEQGVKPRTIPKPTGIHLSEDSLYLLESMQNCGVNQFKIVYEKFFTDGARESYSQISKPRLANLGSTICGNEHLFEDLEELCEAKLVRKENESSYQLTRKGANHNHESKPTKNTKSGCVAETDKVLYKKLIDTLPWDGSLSFIQKNNFAGFSFELGRLDQLYDFFHICQNPAFEFIDLELEELRSSLFKTIDNFTTSIGMNTFPCRNSSNRNEIPSEWEEEQPERFRSAVLEIHNTAQSVCRIYQELIKLGTRKLGVLPEIN